MRIMQGYAYKFGSPNNLNFFGNQAACTDLISKPYSNNDINISLMCRVMRANGKFEKGQLGVSLPINKFDSLLKGIVSTINPVSSSKEKKRILNTLKDVDLASKIDINYNYGIRLKEYDSRVNEARRKKL